MTDDDLNAIASMAFDGRYGTHWQGCETTHPRCAVLKLVDEVRRLRAQLERIRQMTGVVHHRDDQVAECYGCGCISATAEECVAELMARYRAELEQQKAATLATAERLAECSAVLSRAAERGKVQIRRVVRPVYPIEPDEIEQVEETE